MFNACGANFDRWEMGDGRESTDRIPIHSHSRGMYEAQFFHLAMGPSGCTWSAVSLTVCWKACSSDSATSHHLIFESHSTLSSL